MYFQSLMPRPEIGAHSFLFDFDGTRVVVDAGMHPKQVGRDALPEFERAGDQELDAIIVTHAHLDHAGTLPLLQRRHPRTPVFLTAETAALADIMLHNSVNVMSNQREELSLPEYPLFTHAEVEEATEQWVPRRYEQPFEIGSNGVRAKFYSAGHVLGAAGVWFETPCGRTIFQTGDVNFEDQSLTQGAEFPSSGIDTLVLETTRGDNPRDPGYTREKEAQKLAESIRRTFKKGGSVLMPVFALGKSQELLLLLHELKVAGEIPVAPIYIGGLSLKITRVTDDFADRSRRRYPGFRLLQEIPELQISPRPPRKGTRRPMVYRPGALYLLSSGMMTENTVSNDFAFDFIDNPANLLAFVGYADPDSPGGRLKAAPRGYPFVINEMRSPVPLECEVESFDFSGHSDRETLRAYANKVKPRQIILVHGDEPALKWFESTLSADMPDCRVITARKEEKIAL